MSVPVNAFRPAERAMSEPIFLGYDRAALDREYDNRAKVADAAEHIAWYQQRSARTRAARREAWLDVPFGAHEGERLDVFPAAGPAPAPVQLFIHGGYWHRMDKSDFSFVADTFCPRNVVTVVINYALMPAVRLDELVRQCRAALAWTWREAGAYGADRDRLYVSGHSAGGHLVAMLMATDWRALGSDLPRNPIRGGCGISGLYDLEPIRLCYLNEVLQLAPEEAERNSPVHLEPAVSSPLLLPVGELEGAEYLRQSQALAEAWSPRDPPRHGSGPEVMVLPERHHFSVMTDLADPGSALSRAIFAQMGVGGG